MPTSSADPDALDDYVSNVATARETPQLRIGDLEDALIALKAALPSGCGAQVDTSFPSGPLTRVGNLDDSVATVAQRFRDAGSDAGIVTVDDTELGDPIPPSISPARRRELAEIAADEYANMAENDADPTTPDELAGYLLLINEEIDAAGEGLTPAEAFEARIARAEELLEHAGPRDMIAALELIQSDIEAGGDRQDRAEVLLGDLGVYLSLGLERDPLRAQGWMDVIDEEWSWDAYHGDDTERAELLALLATNVDTGSRVLGEEIFWTIFDAPPHPDLDNSLLEAVGGDSSYFTVMFEGFADSPRLANAIVDRGIGLESSGDGTRAARWDALLDARYDGFENGGDGTGDDSDDARYQRSVRDLLVAATSESLLPEERTATALHLLAYLEDHAGNDDRYVRFSGPVREAVGLTVDPLLDAWIAGDRHTLAVPGDPAIPLPAESMELLQRTLDRIALDPTSAQALAATISDFTEEQINEAVNSDDPLAALEEFGVVIEEIVGSTSGARYDALRDTVEGGGGLAAAETFFSGLLGSAPYVGAPATLVYDTLKAYHGDDVAGGGELLEGSYSAFVRTQLLLAHIDNGDVTVSPELQTRLENEAESGGVAAIEDLILNDPELRQISEVIRDEFQAVNPTALDLIDTVFAE